MLLRLLCALLSVLVLLPQTAFAQKKEPVDPYPSREMKGLVIDLPGVDGTDDEDFKRKFGAEFLQAIMVANQDETGEYIEESVSCTKGSPVEMVVFLSPVSNAETEKQIFGAMERQSGFEVVKKVSTLENGARHMQFYLHDNGERAYLGFLLNEVEQDGYAILHWCKADSEVVEENKELTEEDKQVLLKRDALAEVCSYACNSSTALMEENPDMGRRDLLTKLTARKRMLRQAVPEDSEKDWVHVISPTYDLAVTEFVETGECASSCEQIRNFGVPETHLYILGLVGGDGEDSVQRGRNFLRNIKK